MSSKTPIVPNVKDKIHTIRGVQVILDEDIAQLYGVETRRLNEQVKRNQERFPNHFMFQLNEIEFGSLRSQNATLENGRGKHRKYLPYVFTEQGVSMLAGVLRSKTAIAVSIQIIEAFVQMRKFIQSNAVIFQRLGHIEKKQIEFDGKFEKVFKAIEHEKITPNKGIFYNGQTFDAYAFVSKLIKSAKKSIILIDNYIDESVLLLLSKRKKNVSCNIYTQNIKAQLTLDLQKHNEQYQKITVEKFNLAHDRFLIIDNKELYHIGASLKDLGKKWFAFSKFNQGAVEMLDKLASIKTKN